MPIFETLLGVNPEIEKFEYLNNVNVEDPQYSAETDIKDTYFLHNYSHNYKVDLIKDRLESFFCSLDEEIKISSKVYLNVLSFVDQLYPSLFDKLIVDNVYSSSYGTLIIDWDKNDNDVFSLEIGSETLGYFIEIDGVDQKQIEEKEIKESFSSIIMDLESFLE